MKKLALALTLLTTFIEPQRGYAQEFPAQELPLQTHYAPYEANCYAGYDYANDYYYNNHTGIAYEDSVSTARLATMVVVSVAVIAIIVATFATCSHCSH